MHQGLELISWFGIAVLALGSARILLWRTRVVLERSRPVAHVQKIRLSPVSAFKEVTIVPVAVPQSA